MLREVKRRKEQGGEDELYLRDLMMGWVGEVSNPTLPLSLPDVNLHFVLVGTFEKDLVSGRLFLQAKQQLAGMGLEGSFFCEAFETPLLAKWAGQARAGREKKRKQAAAMTEAKAAPHLQGSGQAGVVLQRVGPLVQTGIRWREIGFHRLEEVVQSTKTLHITRKGSIRIIADFAIVIAIANSCP